MEHLPLYLSITFGVTVILTVFLFSKATHYSNPILFFLSLLIVVQSALGLSGFYNDVNTMTNRFPLLVMPLLAVFASMFFTQKGKAFIDSLDIRTLTIVHIIRIPVEIVLLGLFLYGAIPEAMSFEGRNFDILSGITAPLVYYFGFIKQKLNRTVLIAWNAICLLLLLNVVSSAVLSLPARFQSFGFEQPNIAVGYFPFLLLPALLVPIVLFSNAAAIRKLILNNDLNIKK